MISLVDYTACLGGRAVLHGVTFHAGGGELVALCGPNGAGKSTMLRALAGLMPGGTPAPRRIAYLEQGARCAWGLTVSQVTGLGRIPHGDSNAAAVRRALEACGVAGLANRRIDRLSGGQARRAMLARALATAPDVLLLDEPVADLDPAACYEIMDVLADFAASGGLVVAVLHAVELAVARATRMVVLAEGLIVADGAPLAALPDAAKSFGMAWGVDGSQRLLAPPRPGAAIRGMS